jgi:RNA polymerase sigma-70 factor (ECF subfamily)
MGLAASDRQLIEQIAVGDGQALQRLFARHQVRIFRFITRIVRNHAVAEELANEVFIEVWRNARRYEGRSSATTWMLAIAHHKASSALRKRTEAPLEDAMAASIADDGDTPEIAAQKRDKGSLLRACINRLSPEHRAVLDLVYYHEQSIEDVSSVLGIPEATVKTRMFYARKRLSELLEGAGVDRGWP